MITIHDLLPRDLLLQIIKIAYEQFLKMGDAATVEDFTFLKEFGQITFCFLSKFTLYTTEEVELFKEITNEFQLADMENLKLHHQYNYNKLRFK